jgi:glutamate racemase
MKMMDVAKEMAVALGCSHYKLVSVQIQNVVGNHLHSKECRKTNGNLAELEMTSRERL